LVGAGAQLLGALKWGPGLRWGDGDSEQSDPPDWIDFSLFGKRIHYLKN
jgi:hypothetical protein